MTLEVIPSPGYDGEGRPIRDQEHPMATATIARAPADPGLIPRDGVTLHHVDWETYCKLRDERANRQIRMTYLDGTLTLMSPAFRHERGSRHFEVLIRATTRGLGLEVLSAGSTTLRRPGDGPAMGGGKEPDTAFYIGENERRMRKKEELDLTVDPPPDLAIEVDNSRDSEASLPIYARLGVPEVWRYDVREGSLWFGRLAGDSYVNVDRSVCLPRLTPSLVLEALGVLDDGEMGENAWSEWLRDWARNLPEPPATA
jgi:Uma2 family endonuclease